MANAADTHPPRLRLFLALWPDDPVRQQLQDHLQQWAWPAAVACYLPADWHVTLHFIGSVSAERLPEIMAAAAQEWEPFELVLNRPELWPHGLAVLCAEAVPESLRALHERLGQALRQLDLALEPRAYRPHLTLARRAAAARPPHSVQPVIWPVRSFVLAASTGDQQQRYRVLQRYD